MYWLVDKKEKKSCIFEWMISLDKKAHNFMADLPKREWIPFSSIPDDIFRLVFEVIDRSKHIIVDRDLHEFMITDKKKFPSTTPGNLPDPT